MRKRAQAGSICRKGDWWVLRYRQPIVVSGTLRTVQRCARLVPVDAHHKTKRSVKLDCHIKSKIAEILEPINSRKYDPQTVRTLGEFVETNYLPYVKSHRRPSTYKGYRDMWEDHLKARCDTVWLRDVRTPDVQRWLDSIAREDGLSKASLKHIKHLLGGIFRYAQQQGYYDSGKADPVKPVSIPDAPSGGETYAYSLEEIEKMLAVLPEPAATVVATAALTGLRRGEIRGLLWENYDPSDVMPTIRVTRSVWNGIATEPKTTKSKAPVLVIAPLAKLLEAHRKATGNPLTGPIFVNSLGRPLDLDGLYRRQMLDIFAAAGIKWHGWHSFRRGLATNLNRLGVDHKTIQSILRHSNVSTTQNNYIKSVPADAVAAMKQLEALMFPNCSPTAPESATSVVN